MTIFLCLAQVYIILWKNISKILQKLLFSYVLNKFISFSNLF